MANYSILALLWRVVLHSNVTNIKRQDSLLHLHSYLSWVSTHVMLTAIVSSFAPIDVGNNTTSDETIFVISTSKQTNQIYPVTLEFSGRELLIVQLHFTVRAESYEPTPEYETEVRLIYLQTDTSLFLLFRPPHAPKNCQISISDTKQNSNYFKTPWSFK